jgi:hypothetical protein
MKTTPKNKNNKRSLKKQEKKKKRDKKNLVFKLYKTIAHYFPDLFDRIREMEDCRQKKDYELTELIVAGIMMFVLKKESRNAFNNEREEENFKKNYEKIFKVRLPHMDTLDKVMRGLKERELERLKTILVKNLLKKRTFHKYRLSGGYHRIAIDGTHVMTVNEGHCDNCLHRTSKTGKTTYFHNVVEAKLITDNGFSVSLTTEWIENPSGDYDKQDCERKAFVRLAETLKKEYPQLPICIVADGLYPNQTFFDICKKNKWAWIVTFKDGNLPSVWEEVLCLKDITENNTRQSVVHTQGKTICQNYTWIGDLDYQGFPVNWYECKEQIGDQTTRFVYLSSLKADYYNIIELTEAGRMRSNIENEGFDIQKNHGYNLGHKYSRISMTAMKNYYQCMQIAHMINQLFELSSLFMPLLKGKITIKYLWNYMLGEMRHRLDLKDIDGLLTRKIQFRYQ